MDGKQSPLVLFSVSSLVVFPSSRTRLSNSALCSHNEASPVSILEALACEVPVVATDVGSVAESVVEGETGRLVQPGNIPAFSDAIASLLSDPADRERMGQNGRRHVLESGSLDAMVRGYENLVIATYDEKTTPESSPVRAVGLQKQLASKKAVRG